MSVTGFIFGTAFDVFAGVLALAIVITTYRIIKSRKEGWKFHINNLPKWFKRFAIVSFLVVVSGLCGMYFCQIMVVQFKGIMPDMMTNVLDIYGTICFSLLIFLIAGFVSYSSPKRDSKSK